MAQPSTTRKIATLLISLGSEQSSEILGNLEPNQAALINREIVAIGEVPGHTKRAVLREFRTLVERRQSGNEATTTPANLLSTLTPQRAADLLADEPAYLVSLLLAGLSNDVAANILQRLPELLQEQVGTRLAKPTPRPPELVAQVERALYAKAVRLARSAHVDVQEMLNEAQPGAEESHDNATHSGEVQLCDAEIHAFHTLIDTPQSALHALLEKIPITSLCFALRGADRSLVEHLLAALPYNRRISVQSRMKGMGAVPLRSILRAQEHIAQLATELAPAPQGGAALREAIHA